jgi:hypothetical protein
VERQGARVILMASRALAAFARGPDDYWRPMAGYGSLFWRGPRGFQHGTIQAVGGLEGPDIMGQAAPWLAFMGRHDGNGE